MIHWTWRIKPTAEVNRGGHEEELLGELAAPGLSEMLEAPGLSKMLEAQEGRQYQLNWLVLTMVLVDLFVKLSFKLLANHWNNRTENNRKYNSYKHRSHEERC